MLNPIHEENHLESKSCAIENKDVDKDECDYEEEDTKCQFPDTQIKLDLSGPK